MVVLCVEILVSTYFIFSGMTMVKKWVSIYLSWIYRNLLKSSSWNFIAASISLLMVYSCSALSFAICCSSSDILLRSSVLFVLLITVVVVLVLVLVIWDYSTDSFCCQFLYYCLNLSWADFRFCNSCSNYLFLVDSEDIWVWSWPFSRSEFWSWVLIWSAEFILVSNWLNLAFSEL